MLPIFVSIPLAIGCVVGGGIVVGKSLPASTRRRICKTTVKTVMKGAQAVSVKFPELMEDIEDAIAESVYENQQVQQSEEMPEETSGKSESAGAS